MKNEEAVCDTSTIIRLEAGKSLFLLPSLFSTVYVPREVEEECQHEKTKEVFSKAVSDGIFQVCGVEKIISIGGIQLGERAAISLAKEKNIPKGGGSGIEPRFPIPARKR